MDKASSKKLSHAVGRAQILPNMCLDMGTIFIEVDTQILKVACSNIFKKYFSGGHGKYSRHMYVRRRT